MTRETARRMAMVARASATPMPPTERIYRTGFTRALAAGSLTPIGDAVEHLITSQTYRKESR